ncbi:MAG: hypothetical protein ACI80K_003823, partial [Paracoccaceae bacterium]
DAVVKRQHQRQEVIEEDVAGEEHLGSSSSERADAVGARVAPARLAWSGPTGPS